MHEWQSLSRVRWDCKYDVVIIPKYRKRTLYGKLRKHVGEVIREVCRQRGIEQVEGHLMPDHIHMCLSITPKHSVAFAIGFHQGEECCANPQADSGEQACDRAAFLEPGILCEHNRTKRGKHQEIHPRTRSP
jgi:hypothetical protein